MDGFLRQVGNQNWYPEEGIQDDVLATKTKEQRMYRMHDDMGIGPKPCENTCNGKTNI